jgi:hypothetical protein
MRPLSTRLTHLHRPQRRPINASAYLEPPLPTARDAALPTYNDLIPEIHAANDVHLAAEKRHVKRIQILATALHDQIKRTATRLATIQRDPAIPPYRTSYWTAQLSPETRQSTLNKVTALKAALATYDVNLTDLQGVPYPTGHRSRELAQSLREAAPDPAAEHRARESVKARANTNHSIIESKLRAMEELAVRRLPELRATYSPAHALRGEEFEKEIREERRLRMNAPVTRHSPFRTGREVSPAEGGEVWGSKGPASPDLDQPPLRFHRVVPRESPPGGGESPRKVVKPAPPAPPGPPAPPAAKATGTSLLELQKRLESSVKSGGS